MASGLGVKGTTSRCFPFVEEFTLCMKSSDEPLKQCHALRDDYIECLHGTKRKKREEEINKQHAANILNSTNGAPGSGSGGAGGGH
mmetsp:Transcript_73503/g.153459  ORF Transcript_73503/g.153459 Transcript_73503/m.153459 type:complete len:86 (+) Transcript_73503:40-297(+)